MDNTPNPIISICCITYNHENFIRDTIEGFLMQKTTFPVEIIIHDDASTDNTANIIKKYADKHPEMITLILQTENQYSQGIQPSINFVFPRARGRYIALCEGDDYWTDSYKLQKQVDFLEANPEYGLVYTDIKVVDEDNNEIVDRPSFQRLRKAYKEGNIFWDLLDVNFINTGSVCVNHDLMMDVLNRQDNLWYTYDMWFWLHIAMKTKIKFFNEVTIAYRKHSGGVTSQKGHLNPKRNFIYLDILKKLIPSISIQQLNKKQQNILFYKIYILLRAKDIPGNEKKMLRRQLRHSSGRALFALWILKYSFKKINI